MKQSKTFNEVYVEIDEQKFYCYKGIIISDSWYLRDFDPNDVIINSHVADRFTEGNIDTYLDDSFNINSGDAIHVVPDCKYSIKDIRNNYKIKRDFDTGVCNVFTPMSFPNCAHVWCNAAVVIEKYRTILFIDECKSKSDALSEAGNIFNGTPYSDMNVFIYNNSYISLYACNKIKRYLPLLLNTAKKPCVSYKKIEFNTNELTADVLTIVKKVGEKNRYDMNAEKDFLIQLAVLNQHNWRDYPYTIKCVFKSIPDYASIKGDVFGHTSKYPKYVKEMREFMNKHHEKINEKDFNMLRGFYSEALSINGTMFVNAKDLFDKLIQNNMNIQDLQLVFNLTTRITPKTYE